MQKEEIKFNYDLGLFGDTLNRIILREYPHRLKDFINSFSGNQVLCKKWLVTELKKLLIKKSYLSKNKITILGSWYGNIIVPLLVDNIEGIKDIQLIDMDEDALDIGRKFLTRKYNGVNIHYFKEDINFTDFSDWYTNIVINTSCEHMIPMSSIFFKDDQFVLYILQSNNMKEQREHINCVNNVLQLRKQSDMIKNFYSGEKKLVGQNKELYKRFMVIGKRDG